MQLKNLRTPMALKIAIVSSLVTLVGLAIVGVISYQRILSGSIEPLLGKRLDFTARGVAVRLSGAELLDLVAAEQKPGSLHADQLLASPVVGKIHKILILAKRQNELESDIKIFVRDPAAPDRLRLILSSNEVPPLWQSEPSDRFADAVQKDGLPIFTPIYQQGASQWISGLSPIENDKGDLIGILRIDYRADEEIRSAAFDVLKSIGKAGLLAFLASAIIAYLVSRRLSGPLRNLNQAAKEVERGNLAPKIQVMSRDEIGDLAQSFISMLTEIRSSREKLEAYSRNLEQTVAERTSELKEANVKISAMIDSLDEGFFMFGRDGICLPFFARACNDLLEQSPAGKTIEEVLRRPAGSMHEWIEMAFADQIPFSGIADLAPRSFPHSGGKDVQLSYHEIRDQGGSIKYVVSLVQDISARVRAEKAAQSEKRFSSLVVSIIENRDQFAEFISETVSNFDETIEKLRGQPKDARAAALRALHTLKGGAGLFHLTEVQETAHRAESDLIANEAAGATELAHQLNRAKAVLVENVSKYSKFLGFDPFRADRMVSAKESDVLHWRESLKRSHASAVLLADFDGLLLHQRIDQAFSHYNVVVQQASENLGKLVGEVKFINGDLKLYLTPLRPLFGTCVHAFRNAVDHGMETPEERAASGKPEVGTIVVSFALATNPTELAIDIRDDGKGINEDAVRKKLKANFPQHPLLQADYNELIQILFDSGFSTKEQVSDISGRGVGLDAIRYEADRLGGRVWISSTPGQGSVIHIRVPIAVERPVEAKV